MSPPKRYSHRVEYFGGYGPGRDEGRDEWRIWGFETTYRRALSLAKRIGDFGFRAKVVKLS